MKDHWLIARSLGILFLAVWLIFMGLSFGKNLFRLPIKDPIYWLLGDQFSALALNTLNFTILFGPFLVLLIFLIPSLQIKHASTGDEVVQIHIRRMTKINQLVITFCGVITVLFWSVILLARSGWL